MPYKDRKVRNAYCLEWVRKRRRAWFDIHNQCAECGSTENLELDHIDPATKVDHKLWSWSRERRDAELAKCHALCLDCHKKKTREDLRKMDPCAHLRREDPPGMAWCYSGQHFKVIGGFTKNKAKRRGLENDCRMCRRKRRKKVYNGLAGATGRPTRP